LVVVGVFILFGILQVTVLEIDFISGFIKVLPAVIAYILAFSISADLSYDSTGFSLHITSGVRGVDDRLGRVLALLTWAVPLVIVLTVAMTFATDSTNELTAWLGLAIGLLLVGSALSAVVSARYIYPVPPPGTSVMASPEGGMGRIMVVQTLGMAAQVALSSPVIILAIIALVTNNPVWGMVTLLVGLLYGAGILWAGITLGAKWYERAQPETYQSILKVAALY
jgi:ABC-2 type transport system permease protein